MRFISIALALSLSLMFSLSLKAQENEMFKNPGCLCCDKWAEHMIDNGFDIKITPSPDMAKLKEVSALLELMTATPHTQRNARWLRTCETEWPFQPAGTRCFSALSQ